MKAKNLIEELNSGAYPIENTCDTVKSGSPEKEIHRLAVTMVPTVDVIRAAREWGADMLLVHEPLYYDHMDAISDCSVVSAKKALLDESGMTVYRYHDHMHRREVDTIDEGELYYLGLSGKIERNPHSADVFISNEPITALELARLAEEKLGVAHVRIAGERNKPSTRIAAYFGAASNKVNPFELTGAEIVVTGEICEWKYAEYARDSAALGINRSLVVLGHVGSEHHGMRFLADRLQEKHPDVEVKYFECEEVYSYTDTKN